MGSGIRQFPGVGEMRQRRKKSLHHILRKMHAVADTAVCVCIHAEAFGFEIMSYRNEAIDVLDRAGNERREWLPADMINFEKRQYIRFCRAGEGNYDFDGYEPTDCRQFGGRYANPLSAFGWFDWLAEQNRDSGIRKAATEPQPTPRRRKVSGFSALRVDDVTR